MNKHLFAQIMSKALPFAMAIMLISIGLFSDIPSVNAQDAAVQTNVISSDGEQQENDEAKELPNGTEINFDTEKEIDDSVIAVAANEEDIREDGDYVEMDEGAVGAAAMFVDGERVPMSNSQICDFEKRLYACKTKEEYIALMETLAYYNKGVDLSRFEWFWEEQAEKYSAEQIAMMRSGKHEMKEVPNVIGMEAMAAYRLLTDKGFLARLNYRHNEQTNMSMDHCYHQSIAPGTVSNTREWVDLSIQCEKNNLGVGVIRNPDDENFSYDDEFIKQYKLAYVPSVVGMAESEAKSILSKAGFNNVFVKSEYSYSNTPVGNCYMQTWAAGELKATTGWIGIYIQTEPTEYGDIPNVIGLYEVDASMRISNAGFRCRIISEFDPNNTVAVGTCVGQSHVGRRCKSIEPVLIYVQGFDPQCMQLPPSLPPLPEAPPTPTPVQQPPMPTPIPTVVSTPAPTSTEAPTPEPTDETTPEPTDETTPEPTEAPTPEPTEAPTPEPTDETTPEPTEAPTPEPTDETTETPADLPAPTETTGAGE